VSLNAGKLEMANASARVGNSILSEANVSASLGSLLSASPGGRNATGAEAVTQESAASGKNATSTASSRNQFELIANQIALSTDARLSLDLAEVLEITKQAMRDNKTRLQLDDIKQLSGRADFSVSVTTESKKPEVRLDVSRLQTTVRHAKVPFAIPVRLSRGDLRYVDDAIYTQGLEGAIGASTFKNVNTRIGIDAPNTLRASNGSAQLSLDELMRWAAALPELSKQTDKIGKMAGKLSVSVEKIEGPLRSPEKLQYVLTASPQGVSINEPGTGQRFAFNGGAIDISHDRIRVNDVTFSTLDASIRVGGGAQVARVAATAHRLGRCISDAQPAPDLGYRRELAP
jgi:hypothetical protein